MRASVYFNATSRFDPFRPGDTLVPSRVFKDYDTRIEVLGIPFADQLDTLAESIFIIGNMDARPNGRTERSVSVGDVVVVHTPDGDIPMAVERIGYRRLEPDEWASATFVDFHPYVMREE